MGETNKYRMEAGRWLDNVLLVVSSAQTKRDFNLFPHLWLELELELELGSRKEEERVWLANENSERTNGQRQQQQLPETIIIMSSLMRTNPDGCKSIGGKSKLLK